MIYQFFHLQLALLLTYLLCLSLLPLEVAGFSDSTAPTSVPTQTAGVNITSSPSIQSSYTPTSFPSLSSSPTSPTRAPTITSTDVYVNITFQYDNVGANEIRQSQSAQNASIYATSLALPGIPPNQIRIMSIVEVVTGLPNRVLRKILTLQQEQLQSMSELVSFYTIITFEVLGHLEPLGFNNTATFSFMVWLKKLMTNNVASGEYTTNLKAAGVAYGVVGATKMASVLNKPIYATPVTVYAQTYAPSAVPSGEPTSLPTWGK